MLSQEARRLPSCFFMPEPLLLHWKEPICAISLSPGRPEYLIDLRLRT